MKNDSTCTDIAFENLKHEPIRLVLTKSSTIDVLGSLENLKASISLLEAKSGQLGFVIHEITSVVNGRRRSS